MLSLVEKRCEQARFGDLFPGILDENRLVDSLECFQTLKGHSGCVNTLRWNKNGTTLASGSDDRCIKLWRAGQLRHTIETGHEGNVFAVEFLPCSDDKKLVSGAADAVVFLHDVESGQKRRWELMERVKRMATSERDPTLFWAAVESENGVFQFDTRLEDYECVIDTMRPIIESWSGAKSVAVSEAQPHLMAVGFDQTPVRIYDRRYFEEPVVTCAPLDACNRSYHATHVAFNKTGNELVVNYGAGGHVYVFSLLEANSPNFMARLDAVMEQSGEPTIISQNLPNAEERAAGSTLIRTKKFSRAVDFYSDLILRSDPDRAFRSVCHSNRGTALLARRQRGDTYACVRDCIRALEIHRGNSKALFRLIKSFSTMEKPVLARKCIAKFREWYPEDQVPAIDKMEMDVEQMKDDRRNRPKLENEPGTVDYLQRFVGGGNYQTDIKEANFFGSRDQYIVAGSDCGHMFIWNRDTCKIQGIWKADNHILNIVQPHPNQFLLASSGIDDDILIWQPLLERPEEGFTSRKEDDPYQFIEDRYDGNRDQYMSLRELARYGQCTQS